MHFLAIYRLAALAAALVTGPGASIHTRGHTRGQGPHKGQGPHMGPGAQGATQGAKGQHTHQHEAIEASRLT